MHAISNAEAIIKAEGRADPMSELVSLNLYRRQAMRTVIAGLAMMASPRARAQNDHNAAVVDFIRQAGNELATLAKVATTSDAGRTRLQDFIDRATDVDGVARFCLGRFWTVASASQRQEYLGLFHRVLLRNVITWLGTHQQTSGHVTIGKPLPAGDDIDVPTIVDSANEPSAHITWVVSDAVSGLKIKDLIVEGVSLRLTVRNDYVSFIEHNNDDIDVFIRTLQRQVASG
jgi:phospholipid transport system substrate-binding protein